MNKWYNFSIIFFLLCLYNQPEAASSHMPQIPQDFVPVQGVLKISLISTILYKCMIKDFGIFFHYGMLFSDKELKIIFGHDGSLKNQLSYRKNYLSSENLACDINLNWLFPLESKRFITKIT